MEWNLFREKLNHVLHPSYFDFDTLAHQAVFASLTEGIIVLDGRGQVVQVNPCAQVMLDQNPSEAVGKSIEQVFRNANMLEDWSAAGGEYAEFVMGAGLDKQRYAMHMHSLSDNQNSAAGKLILLHNITEQRTAMKQSKRDLESRELAMVDELTGAVNQQQLSILGEREMTRARKFNRPLSAIALDVDHFRRINDVYGRKIADEVLRELAPTVQKIIRDTDLVARIGSDKFAVALPETCLDVACEMAEQIRKKIAYTPIKTNREMIRVTISLGVAEVAAETRAWADLMTSADNAMLKAKQAGRNRIFLADRSLARQFYQDLVSV